MAAWLLGTLWMIRVFFSAKTLYSKATATQGVVAAASVVNSNAASFEATRPDSAEGIV